jgi:glutamine synthetase
VLAAEQDPPAPAALLQASLLAVGLDGPAQARDPGEHLDTNMYAAEASLPGVRRQTLNLLDAPRAVETCMPLRSALGESFAGAYLKLKTKAWSSYMRQLSSWERDATLDC